MLRNLCGSKRTVMMFVCEGLRVSLVTTHVPVSRVAKELSKAEIQGVIALTKKALALLFGITGPRMAVLALNPHAGEEGLLGSEERRVILPAIRAARRRGAFVEGPFPADSFFSRGRWKEFDATIAMYHDQALIPAKLMGGDRVVNLTLGLPFVRTSPAHGTAEEIAWQGRASAEGMVAAILLAAELSEKVRLPLRWGLGSTI
jgi:4-hydroxythreonine-4-phosphate dehydrogenase